MGSLKDAATTVIQCLLCGELLCCNSYCCQEKIKEVSVGSFTKHIQRLVSADTGQAWYEQGQSGPPPQGGRGGEGETD